MTEEEIRTRVWGFVEFEMFEMLYDSYDLHKLSSEEIDQLNDAIQKIARWFKGRKEEILQELRDRTV